MASKDLDQQLKEMFYGFGLGDKMPYEQFKELAVSAFTSDGWKKCTEVYGVHGHILEDDGSSHDIRPDVLPLNIKDGKLEDELASYAETYHPEHEYNIGYRAENLAQTKELVAFINQAFIEDGWIKVPDVTMLKDGTISVSTDKGVHYRGIPLMSGQQWLDRFKENVPHIVKDGMPLTSFESNVMKAAEKASGLYE